MSLIEVKVPDIGDFSGVDVIEVNVKPGDVVEKEQTLITLESDKASMEVPSDVAGTVKEVKVKAGEKVSQGTVIAIVEASAGAAAPAKAPEPAKPAAAAPAPAAAAAAAAPQAGSYAGAADIECDMLVLGAGPGGYSAAFRAADLGMKTVLVERYATLGGVCLNVGCIPSKALLHTSLVVEEAAALASHGITFGAPQVDLDKLRDFKGGVVKKLTTGLAGMAKARKVEVVTGVGAF
ncbi:biotin/lipoyl-containing protein, partial [Burkholderia anthina]